MGEVIENLMIGIILIVAGIIGLALLGGGLYAIGFGIYTMFKSVFIIPSFVTFMVGMIMSLGGCVMTALPLNAISEVILQILYQNTFLIKEKKNYHNWEYKSD